MQTAEKNGWMPCKNFHKLVIKNHYYSYRNQIRRQARGGAIGNSLTEKLGKLMMKRFDKKNLSLLKKTEGGNRNV